MAWASITPTRSGQRLRNNSSSSRALFVHIPCGRTGFSTALDVPAFRAGPRPKRVSDLCKRLVFGWRWRRESNPRTGLCRPLPKPLGHATKGKITLVGGPRGFAPGASVDHPGKMAAKVLARIGTNNARARMAATIRARRRRVLSRALRSEDALTAPTPPTRRPRSPSGRRNGYATPPDDHCPSPGW